MRDLIEYADREMMMLDVAATLADALQSALARQDRVSFCVPGGTTPGPVFDALSAVHMDWDRVSVFLGDERWVPETSEMSNTSLLRRRLLTDQAAAAHLVPLYVDGGTPEEKAPELSAAFEPHLPISVLMLGMGADMHTASLFPGTPGLPAALAPDAPAVMAVRPPGKEEARVTLTGRVLAAAEETHILITGDEKKAALMAALSLPAQEAPIATVLPDAIVHWAP